MIPAKRLAHRVVEGRAFVLEPSEKVLHSFNETASRVWQLLAAGADEDAVARSLADEFDVDLARARKDVAAFVARLKERRLVEDA